MSSKKEISDYTSSHRMPIISSSTSSDLLVAVTEAIQKDKTVAKAALKLFRLGLYPSHPDSTIFRDTKPIVDILFRRFSGTNRGENASGNLGRTVEEIIHTTALDDLHSPFFRGLGVALTSMADQSRVDDASDRYAALMKEVEVMRGPRLDPGFNFHAFYDPDGGELHTLFPHNVDALSDVREVINRFTSYIRKAKLYPTMSRKLLPSRTQDELDRFSHLLHEPRGQYTQASLERLRILLGVYFQGPSELKQRWYTTGQTPRSYFVCGASAFYPSRFLKGPFNRLCALCPMSHKLKRVDITRIRLKEGSSIAMYDFTTFTSNMAVQVSFLRSLSEEFMDVETTIFLGEEGYVTVSFGELLREYVSVANDRPEWYYDGPEDLDRGYSEVHNVAGFLGVTGNIASCTTLHAFFLRQLVESWNDGGVAGDDAIYRYVLERAFWDVLKPMKMIGILALEKVHDYAHREALYLKRGVDFNPIDNNLELSEYIIAPSFLFLFDRRDLDRFRESILDDIDLKRIAVRSILSFFHSANKCRTKCCEEDRTIVETFCRWYYNQLHLPHSGYIPGVSPTYWMEPNYAKDAFVPSIESLWVPDYRTYTLDRVFEGTYIARLNPADLHFETRDIVDLTEFYAVPTPELSYLVRIGVLSRGIVGVENLVGGLAYETAYKRWVKVPWNERPTPLSKYHFVEWLPPLAGFLRYQEVSLLDSENDDVLHESYNYQECIPDIELCDDSDIEEGEILE